MDHSNDCLQLTRPLPVCAGAYEDDQGRVHLFACHLNDFDLALGAPTPDMRQRLHEYVLEPASGGASLRQVTAVVGDFPVINPTCTGRPFR